MYAFLKVSMLVKSFFLQGVTFPAMHSVIAKWAPPFERTQMTVLSYSGKHRLLVVNIFFWIYG